MYVCVDIFKHIIFIIYIYISIYILYYSLLFYIMVWRLPPRPPGGFLAVGTCQEDDVPRMMGEFAAPLVSWRWKPWFLADFPKKNDPSIFKKLRRCQYQISDKKTQNSVIFGWNSHRWWQKSPKTNPLLQSGHLGCSSKSFLRRSRRSSGAVYLGILKSWGAPSHHRF